MPKLERKIITLGLLSAFNVLIFYKPLFFRVLAEKYLGKTPGYT